jgi:anti-sigma B factor antagonist
MPINVRFEGSVAILSNIARLMNDPRHFDAIKEVDDLLDQGHRVFIIELREVGTIGPAGLGLLTTITREVRRRGGEVALSGVRRALEKYLEEMRMDTYWDVLENVEEAKQSLFRRSAAREDELP